MDIIRFYQDHGVQYATDGHKHCRPGWVNTPCPYCTGNPGLHLGYDTQHNYYRCWRCGWHPVKNTLVLLTGLPLAEVRRLLPSYGGVVNRRQSSVRQAEAGVLRPRLKSFRLPPTLPEIPPSHKTYLERRGFDSGALVRKYLIQSTGPASRLDTTDFKHRIIIPIFWHGKTVSFQGRIIRDGVEPKYKACPKDRELIHHKHILYGRSDKWGDVGICVEGVTDVWRFGDPAFAVFGIEYKRQQIRKIAKIFRRVAVVFDDDPQAVRQADKLVTQLRLLGVDAWRESVVGDPGGMDQAEADYFVKQITGR